MNEPTSAPPASAAVGAQPKTLVCDGCELHYRIEGTGPRVLFIQGVGVHGDGWRPQYEDFVRDHSCLTFDNRGIGRSQPQAGAFTVQRMAEDAKAILDAEGWSSAHVVGHSLGGLVALKLALESRERVRSLGLLCTFARGGDVGRISWWMLKTSLRTFLGPKSWRRRAFLELVLAPEELAGVDRDALAAKLEPLFGHDLAIHPPGEWLQMAAMKREDVSPRLAELAGIPTLVVAGRHDRIAPPLLGRKLAAGIGRAALGEVTDSWKNSDETVRYEEFADSAHGTPIVRPERTNALLREHLRRAEAAG